MNNNQHPSDAIVADPILEILITSAENLEKREDYTEETLSLEITLVVNGFLISGLLISKAKFLEEFWEGTLNKVLESINATSKDEPADEPAPNIEDDGSRRFVHLKNCQVHHPSGRPTPGDSDGTIMRIRADAVNGFFLGRLVPASAQSSSLVPA